MTDDDLVARLRANPPKPSRPDSELLAEAYAEADRIDALESRLVSFEARIAALEAQLKDDGR